MADAADGMKQQISGEKEEAMRRQSEYEVKEKEAKLMREKRLAELQ